jgi:uncharacterized protein YidB (DUF937 family)
MDMTDIVKMGTEMFQSKLGDQAEGMDSNSITDALGGLLSNESGDFDLGSIVSNAVSGDGIGSIVSSWLGDDDNEAIDAGGLTSLFGEDKISEFAGKLGVDTDTALSGLSDVIPNMIDKSSEGGNIMASLLGNVMGSATDSTGSSGGIMGMIGKLFGK